MTRGQVKASGGRKDEDQEDTIWATPKKSDPNRGAIGEESPLKGSERER
jgi:hypothetical protein